MLGLPLRALIVLLVNLLLLPRNLARALRRRPRWIGVRLEGAVPERPPRHPVLFGRRPTPSVAALEELAEALRRDRAVHGVVLEIDPLEVGWARLESLRGAIADLRATGKRVVAHLSSPGNKELYLAVACDEVLMDPSGTLALTGLAAEAGFYGEALRRVGLDPELDRIGAYKSFADTLNRGDMTPEHREALEAVLDGLERHFIDALASGRRIDPAAARALVDGGPYLVEEARAAGLLDGVLYRDQLPAHLEAPATATATGAAPSGGTPPAPTPWHRYLGGRPRWRPLRLRPRRALAVVSLEGNISSGEGAGALPTQRMLGAEAAARTLAGLARNPRVAGVVLRVDSRGGSAAASDRIWREVARLAEAKPVVAWFDDVAASGGYYLAAAASWIVAQPSTLTGSIGVVAGKVAAERLLDRLGVGSVLLRRGRAAGMMSVRRRYDDEERARLRHELEGVYRQFLDRVASGRKRSVEEVDRVAQGRVWTGEDARTHGLVDELGGLRAAVKVAEQRARRRPDEELVVQDVPLQVRRSNLLRSLLTGGGAEAGSSVIARALGADLAHLGEELGALAAHGHERVLALAAIPHIE